MANFNSLLKFIEMVLGAAKKDFTDAAKGVDRVGLSAQAPLTDKIRAAIAKKALGLLVELARGADQISVLAQLALRELIKWRAKWTVLKYADEAAYRAGIVSDTVVVEGNLLLNEGITEMLKLLIGDTATAFSDANARLGVGDSNTAAAATQTDLQASTNKTYKAMDTGFPQVTDQTVTFQSTFSSSDANYAWQEYVADNGSSAGKTLNRKVQSLGTKADPAIWTLKLDVTIS